MVSRRQALAALSLLPLLLVHRPASAAEAALIGKPHGRPRIVLDRVRLPRDVVYPKETLKRVTLSLRRAARRANWGAGAGSTIELRFAVEKLELKTHGNVLHVHVSALGELPHHRNARSQLTYSGDVRRQQALVQHVLDIVIRGIITRLADLERERRGFASSAPAPLRTAKAV